MSQVSATLTDVYEGLPQQEAHLEGYLVDFASTFS